MPRPTCQHTIAATADVAGRGYWSGEEVRLQFRPAAVDAGLTFVRSDLPGAPRIPATLDSRRDSPRRTNLGVGSAGVDMVEHVLAALAGLGVDNCEIWTDRPEMPGMDGSAAAFVAALQRVGVAPQGAPARRLRVARPVRISEGESWVEARPAVGDEFRIEYRVDYPNRPAIGRQLAAVEVSPESFVAQIASCRTFLLAEEAEALRTAGLGRRVTNQDLLVFDAHGPIDNPLRCANECARHKALDLIGDLALLGRRLVGRITAHRAGHRLHAELARAIFTHEADELRRASA